MQNYFLELCFIKIKSKSLRYMKNYKEKLNFIKIQFISVEIK